MNVVVVIKPLPIKPNVNHVLQECSPQCKEPVNNVQSINSHRTQDHANVSSADLEPKSIPTKPNVSSVWQGSSPMTTELVKHVK